MTKKESRQTAADCEETPKALEANREELVARGAELPSLRRAAAFAAHVENNVESRRVLDRVSQELATHASELASLDDAIADAKNRILIARAVEANVEDRRKAREAMKILVDFRKAGRDMDTALRTVAEQGRVLSDLLSKLHPATGNQSPSWDQLDSLGFACLQSAIARTPWAKRFRPIAPSDRRDFGPLLVVENRLRAKLAQPNDEAA